MRLIDADEFKKQIAGMSIVNGYPADKANKMCELIDCQPTAYDVDKVVKQMEGSLLAHTVNCIKFGEVGDIHQESVEDGIVRGLRIAITVVKGGLNE